MSGCFCWRSYFRQADSDRRAPSLAGSSREVQMPLAGGGGRASLAVCSASEGLGGPLLLQQPPSQAEGQQLSTQAWQAEERKLGSRVLR